jgi:hypothetical protein
MNNQITKHLFTALILLQAIIGCKEISPKEKELKDNINKTVQLKLSQTVQQANRTLSLDEFRENHKYLSVVYLQNSCSPCYPKFIEWQQKMDSINTPDNYTVLFVIKGNSYGEFMDNVLDIEYVDDQFYTVMDPEGKFLENNKDIPRWIIDSSVLIDSENKIKMVGAPFATPEMTELFYKTCAQ